MEKPATLGARLGARDYGFRENRGRCATCNVEMQDATAAEFGYIDLAVCGPDGARHNEVVWALVCPVCGAYTYSTMD